jgi:glycosyltransferase involved in cell wall biosynthesis
LIREADCLAELGHDVRVVAPLFNSELVRKDEILMARRAWRLERVNVLPKERKIRSVLVRARRRLAAVASHRLNFVGIAPHAYTLALPEMQRLAARECADWFLAHTQAALPVAAYAARKRNAKLGFDCEDLLAYADGERTDLVRAIEAEYLPSCNYVATASQAMADRLKQDYSIGHPLVLYNVYPLAMAEKLLPPNQRPPRPVLRLHWFGQTIGPGRGIEEAVEALSLLPPDAELHVRGQFQQGYRERLNDLEAKFGLAGRVVYHAPTHHDELLSGLGEFDVGLALERGEDGNYSRTVTNKVFAYLLAGLALAATDTPGQREVLQQIPGAGFLYPSSNPRALAEGLLVWVRQRERLIAAQRAAWDAARARFCWDVEKAKFVRVLETAAMGKRQAEKVAV